MSSPAELQVLCRRLASTDAADLPPLCPSLVGHIQRCEDVLSLPVDQKPKDSASGNSVLVHKLKTQITTLLNNGRSQPGRFAAAILIKAVVEVGGYECLRTAEPWVRGLLTIVQKNDPYPAKEIAIITLTRIYVLLQDFQALVREVASPTLPAFVTACLQLVKGETSIKNEAPPLRLVEAIANALCTLTPLYPTTLRPFSAQVKAAFKVYIAPTASDKTGVPRTLRTVSRRLLVLQHYTTPKNGNADEWAKTLAGFIKTGHETADQVFRAVQEAWESSSGYMRQNISHEGEPSGGDDSAESLPLWHGLSNGAERLVGLLETLGEFFRSPTKTSVTTPVGAILDLTARITLILPPRKGPNNRDDTQLNAAIGREEKDDLWSALPDIHIAVLDLLAALTQRLQTSTVPVAADILHQAVRMFDAHHEIPLVREHGYTLIHALLLLHGPSLSKLSVDALDKAIQCTCRDLLAASGHAPPPKKPSQNPATNNTATKSSLAGKPSSNADAYLTTQSKAAFVSSTALPRTHLAAAEALLPASLAHLPQTHLKQALRTLIDRTAVLAHHKEAMVASVLNKYRTRAGKTLVSVYPFLVRDFPRSIEVEVLRSNLQITGAFAVDVGEGNDEEVLERMQRKGSEEEDEEDVAGEEEELESGQNGDEEMADDGSDHAAPAGFNFASNNEESVEEEEIVRTVTFSSSANPEPEVISVQRERVMLSSTLKRKDEALKEPPAKRIDRGKAPEVIGGNMDVDEEANEGSDSDSDGSVQLNAVLEDDEEEDDD
ncbi:hypothetical protein N0V82_004022 [Gnomoniopsis sp. IMI 355080]|nr:hypothetical protein N0V82_004022 [Gnomoniopsis sp. IMI 355080]